ncbi:MAG TPA: type II secretion system protein [Sedimentisphaerales bacterium]|nr:type II secretion system protein [Sedimentisphaerales bacterium]
MSPVLKNLKRKSAFTIIELLTVMSVIIILIGLLVPALNMVKRVAKKVTQKNQFHAIEVAMDLFNTEWDQYPPSQCALVPAGDYCGAMKLAEAMMGQDLLGFHPGSRFRGDGQINDDPTTQLYPAEADVAPDVYRANLQARRGPYLPVANAKAYKLEDLYPATHLIDLRGDRFVLCDVYAKVTHRTTGQLVGMPVLYYRANPSLTGHSAADAMNNNSIYDYRDNHLLTGLGMPWERPPTSGGPEHDLYSNVSLFYTMTQDNQITTTVRPVRADSYILLSAGFDNEYGTPDDIFNFGY